MTSFRAGQPELPDEYPNDIVYQSINAAKLGDRCSANNRLWWWALHLLRELTKVFNELLIETRRNNEQNERIAQEIQHMRKVVVCAFEQDD